MVGYSFAFVADFHKAMLAAARVFKLLVSLIISFTRVWSGLITEFEHYRTGNLR